MTKTSPREHLSPTGTSPAVTVITPAYNVEKYISEAIESVGKQTFRDFEYLLIDDGSADRTVEIVINHSRRDQRVRLIQAQHRGHSAARNRGIQEARGKYIAFLDGDDRWHPRFLDRQVSLLESLPATVGAVFCRSRMILESGTPVFFQWQRSGGYDFDQFLIGNNPSRNGSSLLIRKSCFDEVGGFDEDLPSASDLDMWLRIADRSKSPVLWGSRHCLVDWRLRPGSVTRDRLARDTALLKLLADNASRLRHSHAGEAYVRPAVTALKYGSDEAIAEQLAARAREAGIFRLVRSTSGVRLLLWYSLPRSGRQTVRKFQSSTREAVKSIDNRLRRST
jgi:glycosyltransferase involved in cell wall biosynthesis